MRTGPRSTTTRAACDRRLARRRPRGACTTNVGCGQLTSTAPSSVYLARLDTSGTCLWSPSFDVAALGVALFPGGDLLLSTKTLGTSLGGAPLPDGNVAIAVSTPRACINESRRSAAPEGVTSDIHGDDDRCSRGHRPVRHRCPSVDELWWRPARLSRRVPRIHLGGQARRRGRSSLAERPASRDSGGLRRVRRGAVGLGS